MNSLPTPRRSPKNCSEKTSIPPPQLTGQFIGALIASATTLALGVELYLKALRMRASLPIPKTHHLFALYQDIPQEMKIPIEDLYEKTRPTVIGKTAGFEICIECGSVPPEVIKQWQEKTSNPKPDNSFKAVLERSSDAFQTWRYLHEGGRDGELMVYSFDLGCLTAAANLSEQILEHSIA